MGTLTYAGISIEFDDRLLAHLHVVIIQKFRHGESFPMSWLDALELGNGRSSIWLTPAVPVYFRFAGTRVGAIHPDWLKTLTVSAASPSGLIVTGEDGGFARAGGRHESRA